MRQSEEAQLEQAITVTPSSDGWRVKCTAPKRDVLFRSGAAAEAAAHRFGAEIAEAGDTAVIEIFLRDGSLGGRYVHAPSAGDRTPERRVVGASVPGSPAAR